MENKEQCVCKKCDVTFPLEEMKHKNVKKKDGTVYKRRLTCCKRCYRIYYSGTYVQGTTHNDIGQYCVRRSTTVVKERLLPEEAVRRQKARELKGRQTRLKRGQQYIYNILKDAKCVDCKYDNWLALEFDHLPEYSKKFDVSQMYSKSLEAIQKEIDKCEIVCSNCHSIRTFKRINSWRMQMK